MQDQNVNFFPWNDIPKDDVFPTGCYHMVVEMMEDGYSANDKRMPRARFGVKAPAEYIGMSHFENYVVGTDENKAGINAGAFGTRNMKKMLEAAQIPQSDDMAVLCHGAKGAELLLSINRYTEKEGDFAGSERNRIVGYHRLGEREVGLAPGAVAPGGPVTPTPPVVPPPAAAATPPPVATGAPATTAHAPATPAPVTPPPVLIPEVVETPTPVVPPPVAAAPAAPAPVAPPAIAAPTAPPPVASPPDTSAPKVPETPAPATAPAGPTMHCTICQQAVPAADFAAHVQGHVSA